jgi:hypothetical protein
VPEEHDLRLAEPPAHRVDELVEIGEELRDGHRRSRDVAVERLAGAALVPVHEREALLERGIALAEERRLAEPGPAMQQDQRRIRDALATDHHPLVDPADPEIPDLGDAAGPRLAVRPTERRGLAWMLHATFRSIRRARRGIPRAS